jgi:hypothetical protein
LCAYFDEALAAADVVVFAYATPLLLLLLVVLLLVLLLLPLLDHNHAEALC